MCVFAGHVEVQLFCRSSAEAEVKAAGAGDIFQGCVCVCALEKMLEFSFACC